MNAKLAAAEVIAHTGKLEKRCPACKGRKVRPRLILPGTAPCLRCSGHGVVPTARGMLVAQMASMDTEDEV